MDKTKIYYTAELSKADDAEWFPRFIYELVNSGKFKNLALEEVRISEFQPWKLCILPESGHKVYVHGNAMFFINEETKNALCITTFFDLRQLCSINKELFANYNVTIYSGHYNQQMIDLEVNKDVKVVPWTFRPWKWRKINGFYNPSIDKLFFRGIPIRYSRDFVDILNKKNLEDLDVALEKQSYQLYFENAIKYRACLSAFGIRDMCNRDIEYMSLGIPSIRPRFSSQLIFEIPDDVYIPVEFTQRSHLPFGLPQDHEKLANDVLDTWNSVKNDETLLNSVSKRAFEFYNDTFTPEVAIDLTSKIILDHFNG